MPLTDLIGRILLAALFAAGAVQKALDPAPAQSLLTGFGLPEWLVWPALAFNLGLAAGLIVGPRIQLWALAGAGYCVLTSAFHFIPADAWQMSIFVKNWAIAGGLLVLAASRPPQHSHQNT
ncbi:MAG: DoxX family protein [Paracoccaceae bacterium]